MGTIRIGSCRKCPYLESYRRIGDLYFRCSRKKLVITDIGKIPEWCPLRETNVIIKYLQEDK